MVPCGTFPAALFHSWWSILARLLASDWRFTSAHKHLWCLWYTNFLYIIYFINSTSMTMCLTLSLHTKKPVYTQALASVTSHPCLYHSQSCINIIIYIYLLYVVMATAKRWKGWTVIYIVYNMASWLINWPGALGFYLQPITLLHYDNFTLEFVVLSF